MVDARQVPRRRKRHGRSHRDDSHLERRAAGEVHAGALNISVRDDGCGFDTSTRPGQTEGHFGLDGIIERVERLGGTFEIESSPGRGTYAVMSFSKAP